jgi:pyrimidine deaminase RibD-like protein
VSDEGWLRAAIELSRRCLPSDSAYSVGAILIAPGGTELARGYSRETDATLHAEEEALRRVRPDELVGAVLYSSLEPCGVRRSRAVPCARLVAATGVARVVFALREPPALAPGGGAGILRAAGVAVHEMPALADEVRALNAHLLVA